MLVYCGQTVGWIKTKLGMEVGLGPGHTVLDGDPALPRIFRPFLLWPNVRPSQLLLSTRLLFRVISGRTGTAGIIAACFLEARYALSLEQQCQSNKGKIGKPRSLSQTCILQIVEF